MVGAIECLLVGRGGLCQQWFSLDDVWPVKPSGRIFEVTGHSRGLGIHKGWAFTRDAPTVKYMDWPGVEAFVYGR